MDNSKERVYESTDVNTTIETSTEQTYNEPSMSEMSTNEQFIVLAGKKPIKYLDTHQTAISGLLISLKNAILSFTMITTMSISTMLNNLVNTEFGKSLVEKVVNRVLMYERGMHRIREQFDTGFSCPPFNTETFRPTIDTVSTIYDTKLKEYVAKLKDEDKN
jgi:hypothetical protein